jgi:hypothetical protein
MTTSFDGRLMGQQSGMCLCVVMANIIKINTHIIIINYAYDCVDAKNGL